MEESGAETNANYSKDTKDSKLIKASNGYDSESDFLLYKTKFTPILGNILDQMLSDESSHLSINNFSSNNIPSSTAVFMPSQLSFGNLHGLSKKDHNRLKIREYVDMI